ncbi:prepilin-type N-terminal cleavage/methylation domain-containing protein [Candidatus Saccharibacteria bacterium]|nr:prepilin-type N-terminal cleavage/methylation domain-containing protein [Candidatus Saccharibacteria bacterium]
MHMCTTGRRGFSVVELIVVIAVIAILAMISIVTYNGVQARTQLSKAQSDLVSIAKSSELYYARNQQIRPVSQSAFVDVFKEAGIYDDTRDPSGKSFAVCATPEGYVIVAWNPIVTGYKKGDMLYTYSATDGQDIITLTNSSLSALPLQIDKICDAVYPDTKSNPSAFISWSYDL